MSPFYATPLTCDWFRDEAKEIENGRLKKTENTFFAVNWAYGGQPYKNIGWAKSMSFTSIDPTYPRINYWNFGENCSAFGGAQCLIWH